MYVCHCRGVSDRTVAACIAGGARTSEEVALRCGAGGRCGGCIPLVEDMLNEAHVELPGRRHAAA